MKKSTGIRYVATQCVLVVKKSFTHCFGDGNTVVVPAGAHTHPVIGDNDNRWIAPETFEEGSAAREYADTYGVMVPIGNTKLNRKPRPRVNTDEAITSSDASYRISMRLSSAALLSALKREHPHIIQHLLKKQSGDKPQNSNSGENQ